MWTRGPTWPISNGRFSNRSRSGRLRGGQTHRRRQLLWQNTQRALLVGTVRVLELTAEDVTALVSQARSAGAEGCLLIGEVELEEGAAALERAVMLCGGNARLALPFPAVR